MDVGIQTDEKTIPQYFYQDLNCRSEDKIYIDAVTQTDVTTIAQYYFKHDFYCRSDCNINKKWFYDRFLQVSRQVFSQAVHKDFQNRYDEDDMFEFGMFQWNVIIDNDRPPENLTKLVLFDWRCSHDESSIVFDCSIPGVVLNEANFEGDTHTMFEGKVHTAVNLIKKTVDFGELTPDLLLLIRLLCFIGDYGEQLIEILAKIPDFPICFLQWMLPEVIRQTRSAQVVEWFLAKGASAVCSFGPNYPSRPVTICVDAIEAAWDEVGLENEVDDLCKVLLVLLKYGSSDFYSFNVLCPASDINCLYKLGIIASHSRIAALTLIDIASPYLENFNSIEEVMKTAFFDTTLDDEGFCDRLKFAVLPLLQAGFSLRIDVAYYLEEILERLRKIREMRNRNAVLPSSLFYLNGTLSKNKPEALQNRARRAVLKSVPMKGLRFRKCAVKKLPIPDSLKDFLNFTDFEKGISILDTET